MSNIIRPSFKSGFARSAGESEFPNLWKDLVAAWVPALGPTGISLFDMSGKGTHAEFASGVNLANSWGVVGGQPTMIFDGTTDDEAVAVDQDPIIRNLLSQYSSVVRWRANDLIGIQRFFGRSTGTGFAPGLNGTAITHTVLGVQGYTVATPALVVDTWYTSAFVHTIGNNVRFSRNGKFLEEVAGSSPGNAGTFELFIGSRGSGEEFNGNIAAILIYDRELTQGEIAQLVDPLSPFRLKQPVFFAPAAAGGDVDTAAKRISALNFLRPWAPISIFPDGTIAVDDRQSTAWMYSGIDTSTGATIISIVDSVRTTPESLTHGLSLDLLDKFLSSMALTHSISLTINDLLKSISVTELNALVSTLDKSKQDELFLIADLLAHADSFRNAETLTHQISVLLIETLLNRVSHSITDDINFTDALRLIQSISVPAVFEVIDTLKNEGSMDLGTLSNLVDKIGAIENVTQEILSTVTDILSNKDSGEISDTLTLNDLIKNESSVLISLPVLLNDVFKADESLTHDLTIFEIDKLNNVSVITSELTITLADFRELKDVLGSDVSIILTDNNNTNGLLFVLAPAISPVDSMGMLGSVDVTEAFTTFINDLIKTSSSQALSSDISILEASRNKDILTMDISMLLLDKTRQTGNISVPILTEVNEALNIISFLESLTAFNIIDTTIFNSLIDLSLSLPLLDSVNLPESLNLDVALILFDSVRKSDSESISTPININDLLKLSSFVDIENLFTIKDGAFANSITDFKLSLTIADVVSFGELLLDDMSIDLAEFLKGDEVVISVIPGFVDVFDSVTKSDNLTVVELLVIIRRILDTYEITQKTEHDFEITQKINSDFEII